MNHYPYPTEESFHENLPFKLTVQEILRGKEDGSIRNDLDPMMVTLAAWAASIGYIKVISATSNNLKPLFNVDLEALKKLQLKLQTVKL